MGFQDSFKALSDPTRREILSLLRAGPMTVGEILEHFDMTGASLSHHLSVLRQAVPELQGSAQLLTHAESRLLEQGLAGPYYEDATVEVP